MTLLSLGLLVGATACGEEAGDSTSTASPSASATVDLPDWPACADVWVVGQDLPDRYRGCLDGDTPVKPKRYECSFGLPILVYGDQFYAVTGGPINQVDSLKTSQQFRRALSTCQG